MARLRFADAVTLGQQLRRCNERSSREDHAAQCVVEYLYDALSGPAPDSPDCALMRCFQTHPYADLPAELQAAARRLLDGGEPAPGLRCLALLGSRGVEARWDQRETSINHRAIPLPGIAAVQGMPMVVRLLEQMGLEAEDIVGPKTKLLMDASHDRTFGVFYVETAPGSEHIPNQQTFIEHYGIRSVVGMGGMLPSGEIFAVVLFARVVISPEVASLFRTLALSVKLAFLPFAPNQVFSAPMDVTPVWEPTARLRAEVETLHQLLQLNETTAAEAASRAERAVEEEKRSAEAREEQTRLVHDLIRVGGDSVVVLDQNYVVTFMNQRAMDELSEGQSLVGKPLLEVFPELEATNFWTQYKRVMEDRVAVSFEDFSEQNGAWYSVNAAPVGRGIAFFFRDVTERRRRDAALQRTEKLAAVGRMASSISHEINNPLESVTNLLYLIQHGDSDHEDMRTYAQLAASELSRVSHIVTQTLKFHRQSTHAALCRGSEILESVVALYQSRIVTLRTTIHRKFVEMDNMLCFAGDMRQVFANLIGNALDATGEKGHIWLRTRRAHSPRNGQAGVRVTVADNGCGMSAATQRKVFEAFFTTKGMTGTGLGLWVSEEIVRTHRGTIWLRSRDTEGRSGTVFAIFFPD
ncbi:MAG TPA: ATP-binding protein [Acidobacteriaceae bacterium]|nr:ATP-binding protein [Acidobacteriaceae bacterium]